MDKNQLKLRIIKIVQLADKKLPNSNEIVNKAIDDLTEELVKLFAIPDVSN